MPGMPPTAVASLHKSSCCNSRARWGTALVVVVTLLVLLALLGTAFLTTAYSDRFSSSENSRNTQADLLIDGAVNLTRGAIGQDQPGIPQPDGDGLVRNHCVSAPGQTYVSSRVPVRLSEVAAPWELEAQYAGVNLPRTYFQGAYVSFNGAYWVCRKTNVASLATQPPAAQFWLESGWTADTPVWAAVSRRSASDISEDFSRTTPFTFSVRAVMHPTSTVFGDVTYPALQFYDPATDQMQTVLAADSDGDGIADAPWTRMSVGTLNGVDYFYAVRVLDNASAVNASVAWQPDDGADSVRAGGLFPTNVDLRQLLRGGSAEMDRLNRFRFTTSAADPTVDPLAARIDDLGRIRTDFEYLSPYDALWMQLGRRLDNPWYTGAAATSGTQPRLTALSAGDSGVLAYAGGALLNAQLPPSTIEQLLSESVYSSASGQPSLSSMPFDPGGAGVGQWFSNFDYLAEVADDPSSWRPRRALITTRNPVSDLSPGLDMTPLSAAGEPPVVTTTGEPGKMPFTLVPAVASANTAPFGELWRAFWNVMAEEWKTARTPFGDLYAWLIAHSPPGTFNDPYLGTHFAAGTFAPIAQQHPLRMFRSPLRAVAPANSASPSFDGNTPHLGPDQVLLLRAALASVNTMALRAGGDTVPWQDVHLSAVVAGVPRPITVRAFGTKRQPFITEIYAQTDTVSSSPDDVTITNPSGYIAIEIHNPYPVPIDLGECRLAVINRTNTPDPAFPGDSVYPNLVLSDLSNHAPLAVSLAAATSNLADYDTPAIGPTIVPAGGFLVLENYEAKDPADPTRDPRAAGYRPPASGLPLTGAISSGRFQNANFAFVRNLDLVFNKEMILLRPAGATYVAERIHNINYDGTNAPAVVRYDGISNAIDMVPLDAFDFTGLMAGGSAATGWHYARASHPPSVPGDVDKAWHFVYPGRYDGSQTSGGNPAPRIQGTQTTTWNPSSTPDPWIASPPSPGISLGTDGGSSTSGLNFNATFPNEFSIRLCDANWAGPNSPAGPTGNHYPFGGFARRGDLMEITFVGGYRVQLDNQVGTNGILELNPITLDSVFAEDTDISDDATADPLAREQIGRFAPTAADLTTVAEGEASSIATDTLSDPVRTESAGTWNGFQLLLYGGAGPEQVHTVVSSDPSSGTLRFVPPLVAGADPGLRYALRAGNYAWTARLYQYLDVLAPRGDFLPNADPDTYGYIGAADGQYHSIAPAPAAVQHTPAAPAGPGLPIEGQININTAPWKVLACVPFFEVNTGENPALAQAIVGWREAHGPFRTLFDLYQIPAMADANRQAVASSGRMMPSDFEQRFFLLDHVANVLTTRSDSFTCYVTLMGWRGLGTGKPELVERRHCAFELDRSGEWSLPPELSVQTFLNP